VDPALASIGVACITGAFSLLAILLAKMKRENHADHQVVQGLVRIMHKSVMRTEGKIDRVSDKLSDHLEHHPK
jgi:hypothetical protein